MYSSEKGFLRAEEIFDESIYLSKPQ